MPRRYYGGNSALEQYGGTEFDPLTGRLNGGQLVMQVLNQIAALKEKKQQGEWDIEDRLWQDKQRSMAEQNATLDIESKRRAAKDYVDPREKVKYDAMSDYFSSVAKAQQAEREIKLRGEEARKTAAAKPKTAPSKPTLSFDSAYQYTKKIEKFMTRITAERTRLEADLEKEKPEYEGLSKLVAKNPKSMASAKYLYLKKRVEEGESRRSALSELEAKLGPIWAALNNGQPLSTEDANIIEKLLSTDLAKASSGKSRAELEAEKSGVTLDTIK